MSNYDLKDIFIRLEDRYRNQEILPENSRNVIKKHFFSNYIQAGNRHYSGNSPTEMREKDNMKFPIKSYFRIIVLET